MGNSFDNLALAKVERKEAEVKVVKDGKVYHLQGEDAWNERRFDSLKNMNPKGKVVIVELDGNKDKFLVPIGELTVQPEPRNY